MTSDPDTGADYGPSGYLPNRAAQRARKIVLREQMGLGWPLAAAVAGLLLVVVGAVYLMTRSGEPEPPFAALVDIDEVDPAGAAVVPSATGGPVLIVRAGGGVRAFAAPGSAVAFCQPSGRLEGAGGEVWTLTGRLVGGQGESLRALPALEHDGVIYVDLTAPRAPAPSATGEAPRCTNTG